MHLLFSIVHFIKCTIEKRILRFMPYKQNSANYLICRQTINQINANTANLPCVKNNN